MNALPIVVQKFGGSSLADPDRLADCAERAVEASRNHRLVVVVSAMGDTTNWLMGLAGEISSNPDGSVTLHFGPKAPEGPEAANWIQTRPGKGWFALLRLYGPLEPWFDQTWRPGDIELVD